MAKAKIYRLAGLVERFGGVILGDPQTPVSQVATLQSAGAEHISFLAHAKYRKQLALTGAGAVIVGASARDLTQLPRIVCDDPYLYFAKVSALFNPQQAVRPGVHESAVIERGIKMPASVSVGAGAYIGRGSSAAYQGHQDNICECFQATLLKP